MCLNLVVHPKEISAKTATMERPVTMEPHIQSGHSSRDGVFDAFNLSYRGIPVNGISRRYGIKVIWMMLACLGGMRTERGDDWVLCTLGKNSAWSDASAAVMLGGGVRILSLTRLATKIGLTASSRGAANAATTEVGRKERRDVDSISTGSQSISYEMNLTKGRDLWRPDLHIACGGCQ